MSLRRASTPSLLGLACVALLLYGVAEHSLAPEQDPHYSEKLKAVSLMRDGETAILVAKRRLDIPVDRENDPERYGVIGPQFSLITTDRGAQAAKSLAAHPNFAAAVTDLLVEAGIGRGDLVAIGMTGSLPGLNIAVLAACRALDAEPVITTSLGSSMFGATDPELTWLDMESALVSKGVLPYRSVAASLGGGGDVGRGLSPAGRQLLQDAIERNKVRLLQATDLLEALRARVELYDTEARMRGKQIRLYVNVGGGLVSLGGAQNARLVPAGLTRRLATRNYPNRGVVNVLGERGVPILNLLEVDRVARETGVTDESGRTAAPGEGPLFYSYRYNLWIVAGAALLLLAANIFVLRLDIRQQVLGRPHPEGGHRR